MAASLSLTEPGVWENHCRLDYRAGEGFFLIATPPAEARVNSAVVEGAQRLSNGSEIELGAVRLRFTLADPVPRSPVVQESIAWGFLAAVVAVQCWLIVRVLP